MKLELLEVIIATLGSLVVLEIKSIKFKPISFCLKWIGKQLNESLKQEISLEMKKMNEDIDSKVASIETELNGIKGNIKDIEDNSVDKEVRQLRSEIFSFSSRCKMKINHTEDEFKHILEQIRRYECLIDKYKIANGVIEVQAEYIKSIYKQKLETNDFLV